MQLSKHSDSMIILIVFIIGMVTLSTHAAGLKTNNDARIDDKNAGHETCRDSGFSDYLSLDESNNGFFKSSFGAEGLRLKRNQSTSVNHNKWKQCRWMQCWYYGNFLTETSENPNCCAMV